MKEQAYEFFIMSPTTRLFGDPESIYRKHVIWFKDEFLDMETEVLKAIVKMEADTGKIPDFVMLNKEYYEALCFMEAERRGGYMGHMLDCFMGVSIILMKEQEKPKAMLKASFEANNVVIK